MSRPLLVMREHNTLYGLWAESVREVQSSFNVTPLPKKLPYFEGVSNYKGTIIPVFSLDHISGREGQEALQEKVTVILESGKDVLGLAVSEVLYVTENTEEQMAWDNVRLNNGILQVSEIVRLEEPVFVLDVERTLEELVKSE